MKRLEKFALDSMGDDSGVRIDHDLDETLKLLVEHRKNGYAGLGYEAKNDGEGGRTVTIHFPSPSDAAKYEAMVEQGMDPAHLTAPGDVPGSPAPSAPSAPAPMAPSAGAAAEAKRNVVVRIAMDKKAMEKTLYDKYPREFMDSMSQFLDTK